jgi:hypothetical protein
MAASGRFFGENVEGLFHYGEGVTPSRRPINEWISRIRSLAAFYSSPQGEWAKGFSWPRPVVDDKNAENECARFSSTIWALKLNLCGESR